MSWLDNLSSLSEKVQSTVQNMEMPKIDSSMLEKLTLTTPELQAERQRIDEEEKRKENLRSMLADMLPWDTRDRERDMLVDECKEAILQLSMKRETFFGPYEMPPVGAKTAENSSEEEQNQSDRDKPSAESLEKLSKLEPLPPLLQNFDFRAHVGLIEKVLKEDANLVDMQSKLSGGGARERTFWQNYFFYCAYTRYEAGLSIDEIWSDEPNFTDSGKSDCGGTSLHGGLDDDEKSEIITFEDSSTASKTESANAVQTDDLLPEEDQDVQKPITKRQESDFEIVDGDGESSNGTSADMFSESLNPDNYELDELEAEIARELED